jgi:hypothetical protein
MNSKEQDREEKFQAAVIELHNIARMVETTVGRGLLSEDLRNCADRLHQLTRYDYITKN